MSITNESLRPSASEERSLLSERTAALYQQFLRREPAEVVQLKDACLSDLVASGIGRSCLQVGDVVPLFNLRNPLGRQVSAAALLESGPLVISFYRGSWCGFCNLEMRALQEAHPAIREAGATLVAISPDVSDGTRDIAAMYDLQFDLLFDRGNEVARQFGLSYAMDERMRPIYKDRFGIDIAEFNADGAWLLPLTATYVADRTGRIVQAFTDPDHTVRLEPGDIVRTLRALRGAYAP